MKVTQDLALKQSMTMTHEMRFAIEMLTMNALEIEQLIDDELEKNPCLEESDDYASFAERTNFDRDSLNSHDVALLKTAATTDFRYELIRQIRQSHFNCLEQLIGEFIVNNLDDDGFLTDSDDVAAIMFESLGIFPEWVESVRRRIMDLEPLGCAAQNIQETLRHQAEKLSYPHDKFITLLNEINRNPSHKIPFHLMTKIRDDKELFELKKLNPRPSSPFYVGGVERSHIFPDLAVQRNGNNLTVLLLKRPSQRLLINKGTAVAKTKEGAFLKEHRKKANFLMRSLTFRESNLLVVAQTIVQHQSSWFLSGDGIKPLSLRDIAEICGLHESSVSRLVNGKYLACSQGTFELRYFFGQAVMADDLGEGLSARSIKDQIKSIVLQENKCSPLSDQKIMERLQAIGISISRRTVTKYRESLNIASTIERKVLVGAR